jgi:hypothetical protein
MMDYEPMADPNKLWVMGCPECDAAMGFRCGPADAFDEGLDAFLDDLAEAATSLYIPVYGCWTLDRHRRGQGHDVPCEVWFANERRLVGTVDRMSEAISLAEVHICTTP